MNKKYAVMYHSDGDVTRIDFELPRALDADMVVLIGAGVLFYGDCSPGGTFCVVDVDKGKVVTPSNPYHHYGWHPAFKEDASSQYTYGSTSNSSSN